MVTVVVVLVLMLKKESQSKGNRKSSSSQQWFSGLTDSFAYFPTKSCSSVFLLCLSPPRQVDERLMKVNQEPSVSSGSSVLKRCSGILGGVKFMLCDVLITG